MKPKIGTMSLRSVGGVMSKQARFRIYRFAVARVAANLLDIIGLAGIALLAASFGAFATAGGSVEPIGIPVIGEVVINERAAVLVAFLIAGTFILKSAFSIWLNLKTALFVASLEAEFSKTLAQDYFTGGSEGDLGFSDSLSEFQNISMSSTAALSSFVNARIAAISEITLLVGILGSMILINPIAAVAMFLYLGSVLWALSQFVTKRIRSNGLIQMIGSKISLESSRDLFGIRREARASGELKSWVSKFVSGRAQTAMSKAVVLTLNGLPRYVIETSLMLGIFLFLTGVLVFSDLQSQSLTIGVFMAGGLRVVASLLPLQAAINTMINGANQGKFALERLRAILKNEDETHEPPKAEHDGKALGLSFSEVSFSYPEGGMVLKDVNFEVLPGQKVALVGPSGAGKTTTFELATGFRLSNSGEIRLGGASPRDMLVSGQGAIGIVPQRPHLVTGTLAENVSLVSNSKTDLVRVVDQLSAAGLHDFTSAEKLQMKIRPDSGQLSGGEIQRLGLARALYRDPGILFLDEATSALDAETESEINKVLDGLRGHMTIVLIAHRLSTVKNADKIIYMDSGAIVAEGTFKELQKQVPGFEKAVRLMGLGV